MQKINKIYPKKLQKGDEIRVISTSSSLLRVGSFEESLVGKEQLEALGFKVTFGAHILENDLVTSSSIASRVADFQAAFSDKNVKCVIDSSGGQNSNELLPYIDWEIVRNNPKIFCAFSDITTLHQAILAQTGLVTYYSTSYLGFALDNENDSYQAHEWLKAVAGSESYELRANPNQASGWKVYHAGKVSGTSMGGLLSRISLTTGTEFQVKLDKPIAFVEEVGPYSVFERELAHFLLVYPDISGLVIGRFLEQCKMTEEILHFILDKHPHLQEIPVIYDADFGHTQPIFTFPLGAEVEISTDPLQIKILKG